MIKVETLREQKEGAGFTIRRSVGSPQFPHTVCDPFLMLDELPRKEFKPGEFAGAPWHPHRGMDTVMYVKEGEGSHEDSLGNKGTLRAGDCQWMTAASGIEYVHCPASGEQLRARCHGSPGWRDVCLPRPPIPRHPRAICRHNEGTGHPGGWMHGFQLWCNLPA